MQSEEVVYVKCHFSRGGFPAERVFHVKAPAGGTYTGVAPVEYCYAKDKSRLSTEPARGEKVEGYILGVVLATTASDQQLRVQLPDGDLYEIRPHLIEEKEDVARVPLKS